MRWWIGGKNGSKKKGAWLWGLVVNVVTDLSLVLCVLLVLQCVASYCVVWQFTWRDSCDLDKHDGLMWYWTFDACAYQGGFAFRWHSSRFGALAGNIGGPDFAFDWGWTDPSVRYPELPAPQMFTSVYSLTEYLQLGITYRPQDDQGEHEYDLGAVLPLWVPAALAAILPIIRLRGYRKYRRRLQKGLCLKCGYDLRASKERCPECGTVFKAEG